MANSPAAHAAAGEGAPASATNQPVAQLLNKLHAAAAQHKPSGRQADTNNTRAATSTVAQQSGAHLQPRDSKRQRVKATNPASQQRNHQRSGTVARAPPAGAKPVRAPLCLKLSAEQSIMFTRETNYAASMFFVVSASERITGGSFNQLSVSIKQAAQQALSDLGQKVLPAALQANLKLLQVREPTWVGGSGPAQPCVKGFYKVAAQGPAPVIEAFKKHLTEAPSRGTVTISLPDREPAEMVLSSASDLTKVDKDSAMNLMRFPLETGVNTTMAGFNVLVQVMAQHKIFKAVHWLGQVTKTSEVAATITNIHLPSDPALRSNAPPNTSVPPKVCALPPPAAHQVRDGEFVCLVTGGKSVAGRPEVQFLLDTPSLEATSEWAGRGKVSIALRPVGLAIPGALRQQPSIKTRPPGNPWGVRNASVQPSATERNPDTQPGKAQCVTDTSDTASPLQVEAAAKEMAVVNSTPTTQQVTPPPPASSPQPAAGATATAEAAGSEGGQATTVPQMAETRSGPAPADTAPPPLQHSDAADAAMGRNAAMGADVTRGHKKGSTDGDSVQEATAAPTPDCDANTGTADAEDTHMADAGQWLSPNRKHVSNRSRPPGSTNKPPPKASRDALSKDATSNRFQTLVSNGDPDVVMVTAPTSAAIDPGSSSSSPPTGAPPSNA